ncbi:ParB/RepB/Spo0J family partition protein [Dysgonomonas sp. ZJ709]|uniref:ParB N-terminal domain-containing protein n=1 Tax=Dysgonomonas sp. ZJ709 TaxID=2709797 RepID=UPI0013EDD0BA|nr:ParB/RepB/Spo0J family partition protein [Dysgonomonas sp. ZJ709]
MSKIVKVDKRYALNNSYFKNRKYNYPDTLLEIVLYWKEFGELPFEYGGDNWVFDTMIERQKRHGVINSQYITPDQTARQLVELTNNFIPKDHKVLDACCGTGQLTKYLLENKFNVTGFDADPEMVEVCKYIYPQSDFKLFTIESKPDYEDQRETSDKWDLIVSNPPHKQKDLIPFLNWLSTSLTNEGKAILLLPKGFLTKVRPTKLEEYIKRLNVLHREDMAESFTYTKCAAEIYIVGLDESYKSTTINQFQKQELKTGRIMEKSDLRKIQDISLSKISINPLNPRKRIVDAEIAELAYSIKEIGLLHPITLRYKDEKLQIVAGECRYRAFILNKDETIPAIIKEVTDEEVMLIALTENLERKKLITC